MHVERVDSADDARLGDFRDLTDVQLRRRMEPAAGLFMAESRLVIQRCLAVGLAPRAVLTEEKWLPDLQVDLADHPEVPVYVAPQPVLRSITGYRLHRGAMAAMHRPVPLREEQVIAGARRLLLLEAIVDHTNVGASFRSAAALGFDGVLVSPTCADPLYRRSVRVSMGAVLNLPWARSPDWEATLAHARAQGLALLALTPGEGSVPLPQLDPQLRHRCALLVGTEGDGLTESSMAACDARVSIPMSAGIDSLNAAAATAVACYALGPASVPRV